MSDPTEEEIQQLRTALKRCSPETIEAAVHFRTTGDLTVLPTVVYGIIERHLAPEKESSLATADDNTRLIEDLGIDSLTLLEIVLTIEEAVGISIENEELRNIRTLGEVKAFIEQKISGASAKPAEAEKKISRYDRIELGSRLPQQPPFLFLDEAEIEGDTIRAKYKVTGDETFLEGHFKGNPIMPASIVFEAIGQAACLWVLEGSPEETRANLQSNEVLFASMEEAYFYRRARPGALLEVGAALGRLRAPLALLRGGAPIGGEKLAQIENLKLAFGQEVIEHLDKEEAAGATPSEPAAPLMEPAAEAAPAASTTVEPATEAPTKSPAETNAEQVR